MKRISTWGHHHKIASRIFIVSGYVVLNLAGLFLGDLLYSMNISWNPLWVILPVLLTLAGLAFYPVKKKKYFYQNFYKRQKLSDALLMGATFMFIVSTGNFLNKYTLPVSQSYAISITYPVPGAKINSKKTGHPESNIVSKKTSRKDLRAQFKKFRKAYKDSTKGQKTLYIILVVLGAAALSYGMVALACGIACSGSEALAYIVGIVGIGAIIFGAVKLIQRITRGRKM